MDSTPNGLGFQNPFLFQGLASIFKWPKLKLLNCTLQISSSTQNTNLFYHKKCSSSLCFLFCLREINLSTNAKPIPNNPLGLHWLTAPHATGSQAGRIHGLSVYTQKESAWTPWPTRAIRKSLSASLCSTGFSALLCIMAIVRVIGME